MDISRLAQVAVLILTWTELSEQLKSKHGRVLQINSCKAEVDGRIINLEPLQRQDGFPRFSVRHNEWNYTFNPCESYNDPLDPHAGSGDQCLYVSMCRSRFGQARDVAEYYTLGLQRTVRIVFRRSYFLDDISSEETSEEDSDELTFPPSGLPESDDPNLGGNGAEDFDDDDSKEEKPKNATKHFDIAYELKNNSQNSSETRNSSFHVKPKINQNPGISLQNDTTEQDRDRSELLTLRRNKIRRIDQAIRNVNQELDYDYGNEEKHNRHDDVPRIVLRLRGIRSMKLTRSFVYLVCNPVMRLIDQAEFIYVGRSSRNLYFELHHKCCCPDGCPNGHFDVLPFNESLALTEMRRKLDELESGPKHLWLILVVNGSVFVTAVMIGLVCCRKGNSAGPYNSLAGTLRQSKFFSSMESMSSSAFKSPHRPPEHLEYSTPMLQPTKLPLLDNCVIPGRDLEIGQRLGGGLFGDTYVAEWNDRQVAVKRFTVGVHRNQFKDEDYDWLAKEVSYLARQRNKHVVTLIGICLDMRQPYIVNEFIDGQSLKDFLIREIHIISLARRVKMLIQVTEGMHFLHSAKHPVLHRDLRAANLLLTTNDKIKICDFGVTKLVQRLRRECTGGGDCYCQKHNSALPASVRWTAPEILQSPDADEKETDAFTPSCDVYSFAMVLWEVASGLDPYEDIQDEREVLGIVLRGARPNPSAIQGCIPHYRELMKVCWDSEPDARPTFKQLTMHLKTVLQVTRKIEGSTRTRTDSGGASSYLKSALSIHIEHE